MASSTYRIIVVGEDKATPALRAVAAGLRGVDQADTAQPLKRLETINASVGNQSNAILARLARLTSQSSGMGQVMGVAFGEGAEGMGKMIPVAGLVGAAVAGVAVAAGKAAFDLGAFYLKQKALAEGGKDAKSEIDRTADAITALRLEAGKAVSPIVVWIETKMREAADKGTDVLSGKSQANAAWTAAQERLGRAQQQLADNQAGLNDIRAAGQVDLVAMAEATVKASEAELAEAEAAYGAAQATWEVAKNAKTAKQELDELTAHEYEVKILANFPDWSEGIAAGVRQSMADADIAMENAREAGVMPQFMESQRAQAKTRIDNIKKVTDEEEKAAKTAADKWSSEFKAAAQKRIDDIKGMMTAGFDSIKGLVPDLFPKGGPMEDPNGPLMKMRRLADVAQQGDKSPWAKDLGESQADAQRIIGQFGRGMITPEMLSKGYVDTDKLVGEANMQQAAEASQEAFAKLLEAKGAGNASSRTIMALLGLGGKDKGGKAIVPDMGDAVDSLMGAMGAALESKEAYTGMGATVAQNLSAAIESGLGGVDFVQVILGTLWGQLLTYAQANGWGK